MADNEKNITSQQEAQQAGNKQTFHCYRYTLKIQLNTVECGPNGPAFKELFKPKHIKTEMSNTWGR